MRIVNRCHPRWNSVKVFSCIGGHADRLGAEVTAWLESNDDVALAEIVMAQSTGRDSHCISVVVFFRTSVPRINAR